MKNPEQNGAEGAALRSPRKFSAAARARMREGAAMAREAKRKAKEAVRAARQDAEQQGYRLMPVSPLYCFHCGMPQPTEVKIPVRS